MIRFSLTCEAGHEFEGWFKNGTAFDQQAASGDLSCPVCGDSRVKKALMAPAIARSPGAPAKGEALERRREVMAKMFEVMRAVRSHVEANFDDVGERFPEEVRKMHYGEIETRDVFGQATPEAAKELVDEGIQISPLPSLPKLDG